MIEIRTGWGTTKDSDQWINDPYSLYIYLNIKFCQFVYMPNKTQIPEILVYDAVNSVGYPLRDGTWKLVSVSIYIKSIN